MPINYNIPPVLHSAMVHAEPQGNLTGASVHEQLLELDTEKLSTSNAFMGGYKNKIINGGCRVAQRGSVVISSNTNSYGGADRIKGGFTGFTTVSGTLLQALLSGTTYGYGQYLSAVTTTGSGTVYFMQYIEAQNCIDLNGGDATMSCKLYQNTGGNLTARLYLYKSTSGVANSWGGGNTLVAQSDAFTVPSGVLTPLQFSCAMGVEASYGLLAYVQFFGIGAVSSKAFAISDWQLEKGSVKTPFESRSYSHELELCKYYCEIKGQQSIIVDRADFSPGFFFGSKFKTPTVTFRGSTGVANTVLNADTATNIAVGYGVQDRHVYITHATGASVNNQLVAHSQIYDSEIA